jgi:hypothetical protein
MRIGKELSPIAPSNWLVFLCQTPQSSSVDMFNINA